MKNADYIVKSNDIVQNITNNIKNLSIRYSDANKIFEYSLEDNFYQRLLIICRLNEAEAHKIISELKIKCNEIKNTVDDLEKILNDFTFFYKNKYKKEIIEIDDFIHKIKNSNVCVYVNEYKKIYDDYKNKYKTELEKNEKYLKSIFFRNLYKKNITSYPNDDDKCISKTKEMMKELVNIFDQSIISSLKGLFKGNEIDFNEKILEICMKSFKGKNVKEDLEKEIDILAEIFEKKDKYDKNILLDNLLLVYRKEEILNITNSIKLFIEVTGSEKGDFYNVINNIISNIYKKKEIYTVKLSIEELEKYNLIDFDEKKK